MKIFLVCNKEGNVIEVTSGETFEEVYEETVGQNNGEFLVEIDEQTFMQIYAYFKSASE